MAILLLHESPGFIHGPWVDATPYTHLDDAISAIGSNPMMLLISKPIDMARTKLVIPENVSLEFLKGGIILFGKKQRLQIEGTVQAGSYQIFQGVGKVTFGAKGPAIVYPEWWGAGDTAPNSAPGIQTAIDALPNGGIVAFGNGVYTTNTITCKSHVSFWFSPGTIIQALPTLKTDIFNLDQVKNIKFIGNGGIIQGTGVKPLASGSKQINIAMRGASDVWIEDLTTKQANFDGLYIGNGSSGDTSPMCERIFIRNVISDGNGRQGLSVVSGRQIIVEGCIFSNTKGHSPGWGVDIEPDAPYHVLKEIIFRDCIADGNENAGFGIYGAVVKKCLEVDIRLEGCIAKNSDGIGINVYGCPNVFKGRIQVINCTCIDNKDYGFWISNKHVSAARLEIENLTLINNASKPEALLGEARLGKGKGLGADSQFVIYHNEGTDFVPGGGILIEGLKITDDIRDRNPIFINHSGGIPWTDIRASSIEYSNSKGTANKVPFIAPGTTNTILEFSRFQMLSQKSGKRELTVRHHNLLWDNTGASEPVIFILPDVKDIPEEYVFKVRLTTEKMVSIQPDSKDTIFPFFQSTASGDGKPVKSETIGSYIEIRRLNESGWFVSAQAGMWTA